MIDTKSAPCTRGYSLGLKIALVSFFSFVYLLLLAKVENEHHDTTVRPTLPSQPIYDNLNDKLPHSIRDQEKHSQELNIHQSNLTKIFMTSRGPHKSDNGQTSMKRTSKVPSSKKQRFQKFNYSQESIINIVQEWKSHKRNISASSSVMNVTPPHYLGDYSNPCFFSTVSQRHNSSKRKFEMRCLPHFFVIGQPKCGTTDLYEKIVQHPNIVAASMKEPEWFTVRRFSSSTFKRYTNNFNPLVKTIKKTGTKTLITGDGSPLTFSNSYHWTESPENANFSEATVLTPHLIKHLLPTAKFVLILRDPVARLYSDYNFFSKFKNSTRYKASPNDFHERVEHGITWINRCFETLSRHHCLYDYTERYKKGFNPLYYLGIYFDPVARMRLGLYSEYFKDWLSVFPREQLIIVKTEDYSKDRLTVLNKIFKHIGVETQDENFSTKLGQKKANSYKRETLPMRNDTRELLVKFYQPFNEKLAAMLDDKAFLWRK